MFDRARFSSASFAFASSFIAICAAGCATPVEEDGAPEPVAVDAVDGPVSPQTGASSEVILGEPTIKTCVYKCSNFCKTMPSGRRVCGETCICVFD